MKKMIIVTPEQWARLQRGSEQVIGEEKQREKNLSSFVRRMGKSAVNPENFDKFQTLFNRFISDQRRAREPIEIGFGEPQDEADHPREGGLSFTRGPGWEDSDSDEPKRTTPFSASHFEDRYDGDDEEDYPPLRSPKKRISDSRVVYKHFASAKRKRQSGSTSTPNPKRKRRGLEVTPRKELLNEAGRASRWRVVKM